MDFFMRIIRIIFKNRITVTAGQTALPVQKPYPNPFNTKLYYQMVGKDGDFIVGK